MPMEWYESGGSVPGPATGCTFFNFYAGASNVAGITELGIFNRTATSMFLSLVRSASALGVTSTSFQGVALNPYNPNASSLARVGTAWTTAPASGTLAPLRYTALISTPGYGVIFSWPDYNPLVVAACAGIQVQNTTGAGGSPINYYIKWHE